MGSLPAVPKVWLVTGAFAGFGAAFVQDIISRGDKVIATGRNIKSKTDLPKSDDNIAILELDVGADLATLKAKFEQAWNIFGHIDVLLNNAGISSSRTLEEADDKFIQNMFNINAFGPMRLAQAAVPYFIKQGHGDLVFISSSMRVNPLPFAGHYSASKATLTNLVYTLDTEVRDFGLRCLVVEAGGFMGTTLGQPRDGGDGFGTVPPPEHYKPLWEGWMGQVLADYPRFFIGDAVKGVARVVDTVRQEGSAAGKAWPLHLTLGSDAFTMAKMQAETQLKRLLAWEDVSRGSDRDGTDDRAIPVMAKYSAGLQ